jgi:hypothetical protein
VAITQASAGVEPGNTATFSGGTISALSSPLSNLADFTDPFAALAPLNTGGATGSYFGQNYQLEYNDPSAFNSSGNNGVGSGAGQTAAAYRTEAFSGTDIPVTTQQYNDIQNEDDPANSDNPFTFGGSFNGKSSGNTGFAPSWEPYPATSVGTGLEYPEPGAGGATGGNADTLLVMPVGISAVGVFANLPTSCVTSQPIKLTTGELASIYDGNDTTWGSVGATGISSSCSTAIIRTVREDNSGTTQGFLNYLADANGYNTSPTTGCAAPTQAQAAGGSATLNTWGAFQDNEVNANTNNDWWGINKSQLTTSPWGEPASTNCSAIYGGGAASSTGNPLGSTTNPYNPAGNGAFANGPSLIYGVDNLSGAVGYADVSDIEHDGTKDQITGNKIYIMDVQNANGTQEAPLNSSNQANCTLSSYSPPSGAGIVGEGGAWNLTADGGTTTPTDDIGYSSLSATSYPACLLTWDLVWAGEDGNTAPSTTTNAAFVAGSGSSPGSVQVQSVTGLPSSGTLSFSDPSQGGATETISYTGISIPAGTTPANVTTGTLTGVTGADASDLNTAGITLTGAVGTGGPIPDMNADQRRTLYSYYTYLFSPAGQQSLTQANPYYTDLPQTWWDNLRKQFQAAF